jgi:hypothetical protein
MTEFVLMSLLFLMGLYIISKTEIFIRYLYFVTGKFEESLRLKQLRMISYLRNMFEVTICYSLSLLCILPVCYDEIPFWLRLLALAVGFVTFKIPVDYFENAYSEAIADFKIKI